MLRVMAGDTVSISAKAFYNIDKTLPGQSVDIAPVLGSAIAAMTNPASAVIDETTRLAMDLGATASTSAALRQVPADDNRDENVQPESGINFVLYNADFEVVPENTGVQLVDDKINTIQTLSTDQMVIQENGFLEVFVDNQAQTPVFFDNLMVTHTPSRVLEVNSYYPSGLLMYGADMTFQAAGDEYNGYKYNAKELETALNLGYYLFEWRPLDPTTGRWISPDPLAEKYYNISPYAFALNNPINFIDPIGLDVYRYDDETGNMILFKETDDDFDQIGKFKYDKKTDTYTLKTNKKGEAKTRIDNIEKGILSDGANFKENSYIFEVGGTGQPTEQGLESFVLQLSGMVGKEIGGAYFSKDGATSTTHMSIGMYKNNSYTETKSNGHGLWNRKYPDSKIEDNITGFFHTHPSGGTIGTPENRTRAHEQDLKSKANALKHNPALQFFILTNPVYYGGKIKFPY